MSVDLSAVEWQLEGWRPWEWALPVPIEAQKGIGPDIGPIDCDIPGSVRGALLSADLLPDPFVADNSLAGEFLENRHWIFRTDLSSHLEAGGQALQLELDVVDGPCIVRWAGREVIQHENAFVPLVVGLPPLEPGEPAVLELIFLETPPGLGQVGRSSSIRALKPRFSSGWDWIPRLVHVGVANSAALFSRGGARVTDLEVTASPLPSGAGVLRTIVSIESPPEGCRVVVNVLGPDGSSIATRLVPITSVNPRIEAAFEFGSVEVWSADRPALYRVQVSVEADQAVPHSVERSFGFRTLEWERTDGASAGAEAWIAVLNGKRIFLAGVNWVPIRPDFSDVPDDAYAERLRLYKDLGFNLIRLWGGAARERDIFYDLCDSLGLLVWQDLPLSSSGLDNYPPDDAAFASEFGAVAQSYRRRLSHHPSLIVWAGGNELSGATDLTEQPGSPLDFAHPALAAARSALHDSPQWKVVPATPSGPSYTADDAHYGKGLHHDVHGPWAHEGDLESWQKYWSDDDSMLRSEVGIAGASPTDIMASYGLLTLDGGRRLALWRHSSKWWLNGAEQATPEWIAASQDKQAELLAIAMESAIERFPGCAGLFVWMGHDAFPCAVSLSIVDFWGRPKPAALEIGRVLSRHRAMLS